MRWEKLKLSASECADRMSGLRRELAPGYFENDGLRRVRDAVIASMDEVDSTDRRASYRKDIEVGLALRRSTPGLGARQASFEPMWRYLSMVVLPDQVARRWDLSQEDRFWTNKRRRLWLMQVWWFIHLLWQGDEDSTRSVASAGGFSTDTVVAAVERPGAGYRIDLNRTLFRLLAQEPDVDEGLVRRVLKLNTARTNVVVPWFHSGGLEGYARSLIGDARTI